ncbi:ABC transporter substrate-binding protein [Streptomyces sp. FH025]|uniref:ABC transporter substrate-binding protein n=1 Tax=Streptomyces sp. FH025 TaxID=2815937 RepID=UPI001A9D6EC3|nr:ABC transporter substrate-binding protein [Streptomyces sp. FH025]MBO1418639.1 carbohydrate ABC transporter substrate-binding protein [Streptomyces sp. FH025]
MYLRSRSGRAVALLSAAVVTSVLATGCASGGAGSDDPNAKVTLTVGDFGTFGYKESGLFDEYMKAHPNITIKENTTTQEGDYWTALQTRLSGGGLDDIQALEVSRIALATSDQLSGAFTDLSNAPGVDKEAYLPWKWKQATTAQGKTVGLGTDVGPMAICYRQDLFQAAGLPSEPAAVSALWAGDWAKYVEVGRQYQAKAPAGTFFMDTATGLYNGVVSSNAEQYYKNGKMNYQDSAGVKNGWKLAADAVQAGTSQGLKEFDTPWQTAFSNSTFATTVCPSWQQANIEKFSGPGNAGKWNIAQAPTAGNWGGSFLAVPASGKHVAQAQALAVWLTAPEQQAKVFQKVGSIPANQKAYALPGVTDFKNPYIGPNAPTGQIFSAAAKAIQPAETGPHHGDLHGAMSNGVLLMEQNHKSSEEAWADTVKQITSTIQ